ncbi:MAG: YdcF family protein [Acidimicrobiia bacterium]|nr:YdcF family protein [Acidimicrobiia bacterium]
MANPLGPGNNSICGGRRPGENQSVVVLGAQVLGPGRPSPAVRRRVAHGVAVLRRRGIRWLLLMGGVGKAGVSEASVMAGLARDLGVEAGRVLLEEQSTSTLEQAVAAARLAREHRWGRVVLVTDRYHLPRARFLFQRMGLEVCGDPARGPGGAGRWRRLAGAAREAPAWVKVAGQAIGGRLHRAAAEARAAPAPGECRGSCG